MPEPLFSLLFDINDERRSRFLANILKYNTMFSFASLQYSHVGVAKHGVQVAKARGSVRHFPSAVRPNDPNKPQFGNFYVYEGQEALQQRLAHPFMSDLDSQVLYSFIYR